MDSVDELGVDGVVVAGQPIPGGRPLLAQAEPAGATGGQEEAGEEHEARVEFHREGASHSSSWSSASISGLGHCKCAQPTRWRR